MKKAIFYLLACVLLPVAASADEGMWLVSTFRDVIYPQMKKEGLKLKPGEIYNEESPALCNAIVAVDGGMGTGSVISDKGLVITNHHVAYGDICAYSRSCGYAGFLQHIRNHCACKLPRRHFIGVKIMRCVYKNLVHAVGVNILGCDIFKIYIVNFNAYFFIKRHSRLCGYEFKLQFRVSLKLLFIA